MSDKMEIASKLLGREAILEVNDCKYTEIEVEEWNGSVRMKVMTGLERDIFEQSLTNRTAKGKREIRGFMVETLVTVLVDEAGKRLFTKEDIEKLNEKSAKVIGDLFDVALELNGMGKDAVEEMRKNS